MYEMDRVVANIGFLLTDFVVPAHTRRPLEVFLCGRRPDNPYLDLRKQVQHLVETRMGCRAFLGEDIEELKQPPRANRDHLTVEIEEAKKADLIVVFLGSAGTLAEVTAFAMTKDINPKVIVFNDEKYRNVDSFVNLGPLKLLDQTKVIFYSAGDNKPGPSLVRHVDWLVAGAWYNRLLRSKVSDPRPWSFEEFACVSCIMARNPIEYSELVAHFADQDKTVREVLSRLVDAGVVGKRSDGRFEPLKQPEEMLPERYMQVNNGRVRLRVLGTRLRATARSGKPASGL